MKGGIFFDTDLLVYAALRPDARSERARALLSRGGAVSVQVLNESADVARRKLREPRPEVARALSGIRVLCSPPLPATLATHEAALGIAGRLGYGFHDSLVIASALEAGCVRRRSEDMHGGQVVEGRLTIRNPFAPRPSRRPAQQRHRFPNRVRAHRSPAPSTRCGSSDQPSVTGTVCVGGRRRSS